MMNAADAIDLLVKKAPELRAAGVLTLSVDGLHATLAPDGPPPEDTASVDEDDESAPHSDPLLDPSTYAGGKVPKAYDRSPDDDTNT